MLSVTFILTTKTSVLRQYICWFTLSGNQFSPLRALCLYSIIAKIKAKQGMCFEWLSGIDGAAVLLQCHEVMVDAINTLNNSTRKLSGLVERNSQSDMVGLHGKSWRPQPRSTCGCIEATANERQSTCRNLRTDLSKKPHMLQRWDELRAKRQIRMLMCVCRI